jgi:hypothetical protein
VTWGERGLKRQPLAPDPYLRPAPPLFLKDESTPQFHGPFDGLTHGFIADQKVGLRTAEMAAGNTSKFYPTVFDDRQALRCVNRYMNAQCGSTFQHGLQVSTIPAQPVMSRCFC